MTGSSEGADTYGTISLTRRARDALRVSALNASAATGRRISLSERLLDALEQDDWRGILQSPTDQEDRP